MDMSINQRLGKLLFEKHMTQEQLKVKLGLNNRQQVSNWINCHDPIPDKYLIAIIHLFPDLNANWLLKEIGNPFIDQTTLRQVHRNEYGYCEDCQEKNKEIKMQKSTLEKNEKEIKELYIQIGILQERINRLLNKDSE